ncbi:MULTISPECIES: CRISPR-associated endoribonuclease Cas6 [Thermus]|jgi:CRISPR-associated endoribonuclease Cas6|uniref:CRISPR-associated endoribonuclease Cas6 n=1 Tax=Thermus TaxID=270 RepID=UPI0008FD8F7A|nr:CRISPR-associated endoribonuclease Cas6 [Thermus brockianus]
MSTGGRLKLRFFAQGRLPVTYREGLQAAIYGALPPPLGPKLHDEGLLGRERPLKLFVYSRILGLDYVPEEKGFRASGELTLYFASALEEVVQAFGEGIWAKGGLEVHGLFLRLIGLEVEPIAPQSPVTVEALAPITVYRTEGKRTLFFNPLNREFSLLLEANLNRKAEALGLEKGSLRVQPLGFHPRRKRLERYKGTWVEGWMGCYRLEGDAHLLRLALVSGLGSKNSQGFGFVREVGG